MLGLKGPARGSSSRVRNSCAGPGEKNQTGATRSNQQIELIDQG